MDPIRATGERSLFHCPWRRPLIIPKDSRVQMGKLRPKKAARRAAKETATRTWDSWLPFSPLGCLAA